MQSCCTLAISLSFNRILSQSVCIGSSCSSNAGLGSLLTTIELGHSGVVAVCYYHKKKKMKLLEIYQYEPSFEFPVLLIGLYDKFNLHFQFRLNQIQFNTDFYQQQYFHLSPSQQSSYRFELLMNIYNFSCVTFSSIAPTLYKLEYPQNDHVTRFL